MKKQGLKLTGKVLTGLVLLSGVTAFPTKAIDVKPAAVDVNVKNVKASVYEKEGHFYAKLVADKEVANVVARITTETKAEFLIKRDIIKAGEEVVVELDLNAQAPTRKLPHTGVKKESFNTVTELAGHTFKISVSYEVATDEVKAQQKANDDIKKRIIVEKYDKPTNVPSIEDLKKDQNSKTEQPKPSAPATETKKPAEQPKPAETATPAAKPAEKQIEDREDVNHLEGATAQASNHETGTNFTADKAIDGDDNTRWATDKDVPKPTFELTLPKTTLIKHVEIDWDRRLRNGQNDPNIKSWSLYYAGQEDVGANGEKQWKPAHTKTGEPVLDEKVDLAESIQAKYDNEHEEIPYIHKVKSEKNAAIIKDVIINLPTIKVGLDMLTENTAKIIAQLYIQSKLNEYYREKLLIFSRNN